MSELEDKPARRRWHFSLLRLGGAVFLAAISLAAWRWLNTTHDGRLHVLALGLVIAIASAAAAIGLLVGHGRIFAFVALAIVCLFLAVAAILLATGVFGM